MRVFRWDLKKDNESRGREGGREVQRLTALEPMVDRQAGATIRLMDEADLRVWVGGGQRGPQERFTIIPAG